MKLKSIGLVLALGFLAAAPYRIVPKIFSGTDDVKSTDNSGTLSTSKIISRPADLKELENIIDGYDYNSVIKTYKPKLDNSFTVTKFKYFVVFSHMDESKTYELIDQDIRNTTAAMENNYIAVKPKDITAVFLFNDDDSYKKFALGNFEVEENDLSPYGFYKVSRRVILVKYISWKGSLSHEVTHAMLQDDFPESPGWFNEGFASLHEKSTYKNGKLIGDFSWRINAIRSAFKNNTYTNLETLMKLTDNELYSSNSSFYYAQSRFLLGYLQERDLMERYYKLYRDTFEADPTGISQLEKLLKTKISDLEPVYLAYIKSFDNKQ